MSAPNVTLSWQGPEGTGAVITMDAEENRFDLDVVRHWHGLIDQVAAKEGPLALVTTGTGKFYSNGLNLEWLMANPDDAREFLHELNRLWGRILGLDCHTTAAVNGHCFGAGALLTSAHDRITMRSDRGYWCMPELLTATIAHSAVLATKSREVIGIHKQMLYGDTIRALTGA